MALSKTLAKLLLPVAFTGGLLLSSCGSKQARQIPQNLQNAPELPYLVQRAIQIGYISSAPNTNPSITPQVRNACYKQALGTAFVDLVKRDLSSADGQNAAWELLQLRGEACATGINRGRPFISGNLDNSIYSSLGKYIVENDFNYILKQTAPGQTSNVANFFRPIFSDELVNSRGIRHIQNFENLFRARQEFLRSQSGQQTGQSFDTYSGGSLALPQQSQEGSIPFGIFQQPSTPYPRGR